MSRQAPAPRLEQIRRYAALPVPPADTPDADTPPATALLDVLCNAPVIKMVTRSGGSPHLPRSTTAAEAAR